ncbi:MAG: response regulator [bacterium]
MANPRILIIEDERPLVEILQINLAREGFETSSARDGAEGLKLAMSIVPDLILLDLMLPGRNGLEVCRDLKSSPITKKIPVIMITAKSEESDQLIGFATGADDYVTKPVNVKELAARIRAALRRLVREVSGRAPDVTRFGDVDLRRSAGIVMKAGLEVPLTKTELRLLIEFADHPEMVLSRDQLLERVWGYEYLGDSRLVDAHIRRLRVKIEDSPNDPKFITTARGLGYRFHPGA